MIEVSGFLFEDEEIAAQARKEEEGIRFIKEKSTLNNPEVVLKLYKTLLQQKLFVTPVGLQFLLELRSFLEGSPSVDKEEIPAIDTAVFLKAAVAENSKKTPQKQSAVSVSKGSYKQPFYVALFFAIVFGISVLGMFVIAEASNNNVNILNYREKIINQYEQWEKELEAEKERLEQWDADLREREAALRDMGTENGQ